MLGRPATQGITGGGKGSRGDAVRLDHETGAPPIRWTAPGPAWHQTTVETGWTFGATRHPESVHDAIDGEVPRIALPDRAWLSESFQGCIGRRFTS
jgi:hypothetical protein